MTVVTFVDYIPAPRFDEKPWTAARIEAADALAGPWTAIETIALDPVDTDPSDPQPRSFTTEGATDETWFRIVFVDADGDESPTDPIPARSAPAYTPRIADVANLLRARTKAGMQELGTFNDTTRPTGKQVEGLIRQATADVSMRVGVEIPETLVASARHVCTLRAAQLVELSYFPEQQEGAALSPYQTLRLSYEEALDKLVKAVQIRSLFSETSDEAA